MMRFLISCLLAVALIGCGQKSGTKSPDEIKAMILKEIPGIKQVDAVNKSPIDGIYEVVVARNILYATADGKYLMFGNLVDPVAKKSITAERVAELSKIDFSKLPLELAIKEVNGTGQHKLVVFADPDCPACQVFEKQIAPKLADTTIYTFLFPLPNHPNAKTDTQKVWCSSDRLTTWTSWMRNKSLLPLNTQCDTSGLDKIAQVATDVVQLQFTPTIIVADGQVLSNMLPPEQLVMVMEKAESAAAAK